MIWLAFARRYAWILAAAALVAIVLYGITRALDRADKAGYQRATAEMAARVAKANLETEALEQRQREQSQKASQAWETERNALESHLARVLASPVSRPVVRLCKPASSSELSSAASPAGSFDEPTGPRIDALQVGRDIGGAATVLAGECERYRRQLSALQAWVSETTKAQPSD